MSSGSPSDTGCPFSPLPPGHLSHQHVWILVSLEVSAFLSLPTDPAVGVMCGFPPSGLGTPFL